MTFNYILLTTAVLFAGIKSDENELPSFTVTKDVSKEAMDMEIQYKAKWQDDNTYREMPGNTTLLNCDYKPEKYECTFAVSNLTEADYDIRIKPIPFNDYKIKYYIVNIGATVSQPWITNSVRLYLKPADYALEKNDNVNSKKYGTQWRMLAHDAPERLCPQRQSLTEYYSGKSQYKRDHVLLLEEQIEEYIAREYKEHEKHGVLGYCAPVLGECGATEQLYVGEVGLDVNKAGTKKNGTLYGIGLGHRDDCRPLPCFVWPK